MSEWMNDRKNELSDDKYKGTCNHVISDKVFMADMTQDMIEEWTHR